MHQDHRAAHRAQLSPPTFLVALGWWLWWRACTVRFTRYDLGRQPAMTKLSSNKTIRRIRVRGGAFKFRALRLDTGNYSWGSEAVTRKTRILDVVYNASNNELVRTQTLVKNAIVQVDAAPFRQWYVQHYGTDIGRKKKGAKKDVRVLWSSQPPGRFCIVLASSPPVSSEAGKEAVLSCPVHAAPAVWRPAGAPMQPHAEPAGGGGTNHDCHVYSYACIAGGEWGLRGGGSNGVGGRGRGQEEERPCAEEAGQATAGPQAGQSLGDAVRVGAALCLHLLAPRPVRPL